MPVLSIIMPTYNGGLFLEEALESIRSQKSGYDIEILAVDDNSEDDTPEILKRAAASLPIRILESPGQSNWVASTNAALRQARGKYISFLHQDDRWSPLRLETLLPVAEARREVAVLTHPTRFINSSGEVVGLWRIPWPKTCALTPEDWFPRLLVQNVFAVPAVMFRREILAEIGEMDATLRYTADWDFWLRMAQRHKVLVWPDALADFRIHANSQTFAEARRIEEFHGQLETVLLRHGSSPKAPAVSRIKKNMGVLSVEVNTWLAARAAKRKWPAARVFGAMRRAGILGCVSYINASRILDRAIARIRVARNNAETT